MQAPNPRPIDHRGKDNLDDSIKEALTEIELLMQAAFAEVRGVAPPESALDQACLVDGRDVVMEYLNAGEPAMALEHLIYMVREPALPISRRTYECIESAGHAMALDESLWERIRPSSDAGDGRPNEAG